MTKNLVRISEKLLFASLDEKSAKLKPPTLWSTFSMLKTMLNVKENIDVRKFPKLVPYLKNKSVGYRGKKSKILTQEDISKFIEEAADEKNLLKKVMNIHIILYINKANNNDSIQIVLILGISGACRREELVKLTIDDISNCQPSTSHQQNMAVEISDNQVCTSEGVKKKCEEVCENICEKNESFVMKSSGIKN
jgi:integrase